MDIGQRTAAVIDLDRLAENVRNIQRRLAPGVELIAVVKADAYGHGAVGVYPTLRDCGVTGYATAYWEEGAALRSAGATEPILLLADTLEQDMPKLLEYKLTPTLFTLSAAQKLNDLAAEAGVIQPIQIKIDTGMNRIGFPPTQAAVEPIRAIAALPNLKIVGAFTHFARADELDVPATERQFEKFQNTVAAVRAAGVDIPMLHVANSPSILLRPEVQLDAVRAGDVLYGLETVDREIWEQQGLQPVLSWQTYVAHVKTVPPGEPVSYGGTYVTERDTVIATVPVGFADGYSRNLSNRGKVRIRDREAPIIGRVCMDQFMVDVTHIPGVCRGDTVHLLDDELSVPWMAELADRSIDEIVCGISKRVPRVYKKNNQIL